MKLIISGGAQLDVLLAYEWLLERNPAAAERLLQDIGSKFEVARHTPGIGAPRNEFQHGMRCVYVRPYTIYYTHDAETVTVIRVLHERRDHGSELT